MYPDGVQFLEFLLGGKVKLFRASRIDVHMHVLFIIFVAWRLLIRPENPTPTWAEHLEWTGLVTAILFVSILLHEFGHCFGARSVGGDAEEILMWPLGGLAFVDHPRRPWPSFVTIIAGPAVNAVLALAGFAVYKLIPPPTELDAYGWTYYGLEALWGTNLALLLFNVIPAFPMDGGRLFQTFLWPWIGYRRAMRIAIYLAFVCGTAMVAVGLARPKFVDRGVPELFCIGLFVLFSSWRELERVRHEDAADAAEPWRRSIDPELELDSGPGPIDRFMERRTEARRQREEEEEKKRDERLDEILRQVHHSGLQSLTPAERDFLEKESARRRDRR